MKLAILDIGTNSIHLILGEVMPDLSFQVLDRAKDMTRLGQGTFRTGRLSAETMARGLEAIGRFHTLAQKKGASRILAVATSAVREAENGGEFLERVSNETGLRVKVLSGEEEARLILTAVQRAIDFGGQRVLMADIGGGSVEIGIAEQDRILAVASLKLGVARLGQTFRMGDPPRRDEIEAMQRYAEEAFKNALASLGEKVHKITGEPEDVPAFDRVVGTSGTILNLAAMAEILETGEPIGSVNNHHIPEAWFRRLHKALVAATPEERGRIKGVDPLRADQIVTGSAIVIALLRSSGASELVLCDRGLREGVVRDFIARNRKRLQREMEEPNVRRRSVLECARRYDAEQEHGEHVAKLALQLFDGTQKLHALEAPDRELLEYAALLHDAGYHVHYRRHHRHGMYLIRHADLAGFTPREIEILACLTRYHRGGLPKKSHDAFGELSAPDRNRVEMLAGLLRVADGLDRSHNAVVRGISCRLDANSVALTLDTGEDPELELWSARRKSDLFEKAFGRTLRFRLARGASPPEE